MVAIQYGQCPDMLAELSEFYRILFTVSKNLASERVGTSNNQPKMTYSWGSKAI